LVSFARFQPQQDIKMATHDLKQLMKAREEIDQQIAAAQSAQRDAAIAQARELIDQYGLTEKDLFSRRRGGPHPSKGTKVAAKYRDPKTGATWSGRGRAPKWMAGKDAAAFLI
jgi:DNA-binding protein H-NS